MRAELDRRTADRLARLELINYFQAAAISWLFVKFGVLPMLGVVLP